MKGFGVVVKLFMLTSSVFIILFLFMSLGQLLFFEQFYKKRQFEALKTSTEAFAEQYQFNKNDVDMVNVISKYLNENKAQIVVVDQEGNYLYDNPFKIVIALADGQTISIPLYVYRHSEQLMNAGLKVGDKISVTGLFQYEGNKEIFYSTRITKDDNAVISRRTEHSLTSLQVLTGEIMHIVLPQAGQWNIREGILNFAIIGNFPLTTSERHTLEAGKQITKEWTEPWSNAENLILLQPILQDGALASIVMVVSSVAELGTTYASLKIYYLYFGIGGIILIVILSMFYSRIVAKPLITLNEMAIRLERMDFSAIRPLQRKDEFGLLSQNLTSLANKLDAALSKLRNMNSQLLSDIERKEQIEQIQREFISDISHELKTPLSIIRSYAEGLRDRVAEEKRSMYTDIIIDECERMETLILNMLMLMRYDSEMSQFAPERFSLREFLERVCKLLEARLTGSNLHLALMIEHVDNVFADPALIERALLNLLSNAMRYAEPGSEITVRVEEIDEQTVRVSVENLGILIPEEHLDRVWDRFYQIAEGRSRNVNGSGLGLAIVKQIMIDHGQVCGVKNMQHGVVFWFTLERCKASSLGPQGAER